MTLHDDEGRRKPRRRRWLWIPWLLFVALVLGWTGGWLWLRQTAEARMDASALALRAAGYQAAWDERAIGGFPFRLEVTLTGARAAEPGGWALSAPVLKGEAPVYALDRWLLSAPAGVTLTRPRGGPVEISADLLRASIAQVGARPPRIAVEGTNLAFTPDPGAEPFPLQTASRLELHLRPGPNDQGRVLVRAEEANARLPGLLSRVAAGRPVDFTWDMVLSKMSAFEGRGWPAAARAWSGAGGTITVRQARLTAGQAELTAATGELMVGRDGRVIGSLDLDVREASGAVQAMTGGLAPPSLARASIVFTRGRAMLGPIPIAPAPRVY